MIPVVDHYVSARRLRVLIRVGRAIITPLDGRTRFVDDLDARPSLWHELFEAGRSLIEFGTVLLVQ